MADPKRTGFWLALVGACLQASLVIGLAGTVYGMMKAFDKMSNGSGDDPSQISSAIGEVLISVFAGFAVALMGTIPILLALFKYRYRAEWFFWFLTIYGGLALLGFPLGTLIGVVFLVSALSKRQEFFPTRSQTATSPPPASSCR